MYLSLQPPDAENQPETPAANETEMDWGLANIGMVLGSEEKRYAPGK